MARRKFWGFGNKPGRRGMARGNEKKYHNKHTTLDGVEFDSIFESKLYKEIKEMGYDITPHPKAIEIIPTNKVMLSDGDHYTLRGIKYNPDFLIKHEGKDYYIDAKSMPTITLEFTLKVKCLFHLLGIVVHVITRESWTGRDTIEAILNNTHKSFFTKASLEADRKKSENE